MDWVIFIFVAAVAVYVITIACKVIFVHIQTTKKLEIQAELSALWMTVNKISLTQKEILKAQKNFMESYLKYLNQREVEK